MLSELFYWLFNMSISASIAGIIILLIGKVKKLPRRFAHFMWIIPFLRMWIPVGVSGKYSLMTLISKYTSRTVPIYEGILDLTITNHIMAASEYSPLSYKVKLLDDLFTAAFIVWVIVAVALLVVFAVQYFSAKNEIKNAVLLRDNIYKSDRITIPATYGVFNPRIIIPEGYVNLDLKYVLAHETAHINRRDNFWRIIAFVTATVHWFNPLSWFFLKKFLEETELACDEQVLEDLGEDEKKAYATALVDCAESRNVFVSSFGGAGIRLRIDRILSYRRLSVLSIICFTMFAFAIGYVLLTNASY